MSARIATRPRPCRRWRRAVWREIDGALPAARSRRLQEHRSACPGCRAYFEEALRLDRALATGAVALPRQGFEERVLLGIVAGLGGEPAPSGAPASTRPRRPSRRAEEAADWWVLGGGLGAAALVGAAAISVVPRLALRATMAAAAREPGPSGAAAILERGIRTLAASGETIAALVQSPLAGPLMLMAGVLALTLVWIHSALSRSTP